LKKATIIFLMAILSTELLLLPCNSAFAMRASVEVVNQLDLAKQTLEKPESSCDLPSNGIPTARCAQMELDKAKLVCSNDAQRYISQASGYATNDIIVIGVSALFSGVAVSNLAWAKSAAAFAGATGIGAYNSTFTANESADLNAVATITTSIK
jgi:hypothetical protein